MYMNYFTWIIIKFNWLLAFLNEFEMRLNKFIDGLTEFFSQLKLSSKSMSIIVSGINTYEVLWIFSWWKNEAFNIYCIKYYKIIVDRVKNCD